MDSGTLRRGERGLSLKLKLAYSNLLTLFAVGMFFYSYPSGVGDIASYSLNLAFPYRGVAHRLRGLWLSFHGYNVNFLF